MIGCDGDCSSCPTMSGCGGLGRVSSPELAVRLERQVLFANQAAEDHRMALMRKMGNRAMRTGRRLERRGYALHTPGGTIYQTPMPEPPYSTSSPGSYGSGVPFNKPALGGMGQSATMVTSSGEWRSMTAKQRATIVASYQRGCAIPQTPVAGVAGWNPISSYFDSKSASAKSSAQAEVDIATAKERTKQLKNKAKQEADTEQFKAQQTAGWVPIIVAGAVIAAGVVAVAVMAKKKR
jgi:hypothetical protein